MGIFDNEFKEGYVKYKQEVKFNDKPFLDEGLVLQTYSYIHQQLNDTARLGTINIDQLRFLSKRAIDGLFTLIYIKNYTAGEDLIDKDSLFTSSSNYMFLLFTRVLDGKDRAILLAEIEAKKQNNFIRA